MKSRHINILLVLSSILLTYVILEFCIFRFFIHHLPLNRHDFLSPPMQVLAQSSKRRLIPQKDYIAIMGDSYAAGYGDWLMDTDPKKNSPFHSAHVLHDLTGKDIISFGKSGRGSIGGIVIQPITKFEYINSLLLYKLPRPPCVLVYFYEGNDLNNNLTRIERKYAPKYDLERIYDPVYFNRFIEDSLPKRHFLSIFNNLVFGRFVYKMIQKNIKRLLKKADDGQPETGNGKYKGANAAAVGGKRISLPPRLQGPALGLNADEMKLALYVFERSIAYIKSYFKDSRFFVVYVPSVLSSYRLESRYVNERKDGKEVFTPEDVYRNSDYILKQIQVLARKKGMAFIDTRTAVRKMTEIELLHGPKDWKHFNKRGYEVFASAIVKALKKGGAL